MGGPEEHEAPVVAITTTSTSTTTTTTITTTTTTKTTTKEIITIGQEGPEEHEAPVVAITTTITTTTTTKTTTPIAGCPYNESALCPTGTNQSAPCSSAAKESALCSKWAAIQHLKTVVDSCEVIGRRSNETFFEMTSLEENLITAIENSFDIIHVCYFAENSSCCNTAETLSELESNITRMANELGTIGNITMKFSTEFYLIIKYVSILSEWTVNSTYPYALCQTTTTTITTTTTTRTTTTTTKEMITTAQEAPEEHEE